MSASPNPALEKFVASFGDELVLAQVLIRRQARGFELRHVADRARAETALRSVPVPGLREVAQCTTYGAFRPLKSAPNLPSGWRTLPATDAELGTALNHLYPGAVADWFAVQSGAPKVTHYREFTGRQTGMYRITNMLNDDQAGRMTRACCAAKFCLKQRLWTVPGLVPDVAEGKSIIPCLEPCAVLLEFARKAMRIEQEDAVRVALAPSDLETIKAMLENWIENSDLKIREADFNSATNPRRVQLLVEKLNPVLAMNHAAAV